jgi:hypothetical protein
MNKHIKVESENFSSEPLMEKPFNPADISITTKPLTVDLIIKRLQAKPMKINLSPAFQRRKDLWNEQQQSQLIESLLIKFPLPVFYFDGTDDDMWLVIDGLQRLCAIYNFVISKTLKLNGLEFLNNKLEGKGFDDLERNLQRLIEETQITVYIINPGTPEEVKFNIFKRLNTNGLVLNAQEIRHAINQGIPAEFIETLAGAKEFKDVMGGIISPNRMLDCEFVTRFISFYISPVTEYKPDLDTYMNEKMKAIRLLSDCERDEVRKRFLASVKLSQEIFGKYAFRKVFDKYGAKRPINKALFEVWTVELSKLNDKERKIIKDKKELLFDEFVKIMNGDKKFVNSISSGHKEPVEYRHVKIEKLIKGVLIK